jgi:hypothetical protein
MEQKKPRPAKRRRAKNADGTFKGDNPLTPDVNEAWEPTEVSEGLPKTNPYSVKKKITTSDKTAGKYSKKATIKPTFGNVTTTLH